MDIVLYNSPKTVIQTNRVDTPNTNVQIPHGHVRTPEGGPMAGLTVPTWSPETALLIGTILLEAAVLYVGYGGLERLLGPYLLELVVGGEETAQ